MNKNPNEKENSYELQALLFFLGIGALVWPFAMLLESRPFYFLYIFYFIVWLAILAALIILSKKENKKEDNNKKNKNNDNH